MQDIIKIETQPALISINFEELSHALDRDLERYGVLVTEETLKDAKSMATELNKTKKIISDKRKQVVSEASEPIKQADEKLKSLEKKVENARQQILSQVKIFEDETRNKAREALLDRRLEMWDKMGVKEEFRKTQIDDLINLSTITGKGNLSSSARSAVDDRVSMDKQIENQTNDRLKNLELLSYKEGLASPLTRAHVETFLFADTQVYETNVNNIINAEIERQKKAEERERERIEKQKQQEEQSRLKKQIEEAKENKKIQNHDDVKSQNKDEPEKQWASVTARFLIPVYSSVKDEDIIKELRSKMFKCEIKSLTDIEIIRKSV